MSTDLPATPAAALRWAADRLGPGRPAAWADPTGQWTSPQRDAASAQKRYMVDWLRRWADQLDAAPATYALPAEPPPEITELWDRNGQRWERWETGDYVRWSHTAWPRRNCTWHELLVYGPLSTVPPEPAADTTEER